VTAGRIAVDPEFLRSVFFTDLPRYEYMEILGRGGMGIVFKVRDLELDEIIAMKVLWGAVGTDPEMLLARFKSEISLNRRIKHPNVCRLHDFGVSQSFPFVTMEYVPGRDLGHVIGQEGPLPAPRAVYLLGQVAQGVSAAHAVGIVHRDLKPANVMIRPSGEVSILDFGLAHDTTDPGPRITRIGTTVGTPHYMSPEQVQGEGADERSDIYSIGVIAYEALAGCSLYTASSALSVALKHVEEPVPVRPLEGKKVPRELIAIVLRCLRKDPATRFQTAAELATQLEMLRRLQEPEARPLDLPQSRIPTAVHDRSRLFEVIHPPPRRVVLVVDDEPAIRRLISTTLKDGGFDALESESGEAALELLRTRAVDLILMDVLMPGVDGFDTVRILKSQPQHAATPVLFMSNFPEKNRVAFASQTGAIAFLPKPLRMATLLSEVRQILGS
jgi:serine/threonine protein kinase